MSVRQCRLLEKIAQTTMPASQSVTQPVVAWHTCLPPKIALADPVRLLSQASGGGEKKSCRIPRPGAACHHAADIPTRWSKQISAEKTPLPLYPRPQMVRGTHTRRCLDSATRRQPDMAKFEWTMGVGESECLLRSQVCRPIMVRYWSPSSGIVLVWGGSGPLLKLCSICGTVCPSR